MLKSFARMQIGCIFVHKKQLKNRNYESISNGKRKISRYVLQYE
jgi:hypothetical protein